MRYRRLSDIQSDLDTNLNALHYCILLKENGYREFNITQARSGSFTMTDPLILNNLFLNKFNGWHLQGQLYACRQAFRFFVHRIQTNGVIDLKLAYSEITKERRELKREKRRTISYNKCPRFKEKEDARIAELRKPKDINIGKGPKEGVLIFLPAGKNFLELTYPKATISVVSEYPMTIEIKP